MEGSCANAATKTSSNRPRTLRNDADVKGRARWSSTVTPINAGQGEINAVYANRVRLRSDYWARDDAPGGETVERSFARVLDRAACVEHGSADGRASTSAT